MQARAAWLCVHLAPCHRVLLELLGHADQQGLQACDPTSRLRHAPACRRGPAAPMAARAPLPSRRWATSAPWPPLARRRAASRATRRLWQSPPGWGPGQGGAGAGAPRAGLHCLLAAVRSLAEWQTHPAGPGARSTAAQPTAPPPPPPPEGAEGRGKALGRQDTEKSTLGCRARLVDTLGLTRRGPTRIHSHCPSPPRPQKHHAARRGRAARQAHLLVGAVEVRDAAIHRLVVLKRLLEQQAVQGDGGVVGTEDLAGGGWEGWGGVGG